MIETAKIFDNIDEIIDRIDNFKIEPIFTEEKNRRLNKNVSLLLDDNKILKTLSYLIAFSQNANSEVVERVLKSGKFDNAFQNFDINKVVKLNPCVIADNHWKSIRGIRQQAKLFHIVMLARKMKKNGSFAKILFKTDIPKRIKNKTDVDKFWVGFNTLLRVLKEKKIPFFQSTTSLLHFLLHIGYDCVKPDLIVMRVAKELKIVENETGDRNLRKTVRFIQEYSVKRKVRPSIIDFYFLIYGGQRDARKFVKPDFKKINDDNE